MRSLALILFGFLLSTSNVIAGNAVSLDASSIAKSIINGKNISSSTDKGSFAIVYGGQDISRGDSSLANVSLDRPIFVG